MASLAFLGIHTSHWPDWITAIATAILAGGVIFAVLGLWDAKKTRHGQLATDLSRRWDEPRTAASMIEFSAQGPVAIIALLERLYGVPGAQPQQAGDPHLAYKVLRWPNLIETIGVLHKQRAISTKVVFRSWGPAISTAWVVWEKVVTRLREVDGYPGTFVYFERLAAIMNAEAQREVARHSRRKARSARWAAWKKRLRIR